MFIFASAGDLVGPLIGLTGCLMALSAILTALSAHKKSTS
jgi:hypothetical protein